MTHDEARTQDGAKPQDGARTHDEASPSVKPEPVVVALAAAAGIEMSYSDIYGKRHTASAAAVTALLGALGLPAATADETMESLRTLESEHWTRPVPPVSVVRRGQRMGIVLTLPSADLTTVQSWRVILEDGSVRTGESASGSLYVTETTVLDGVPLTRASLALPDDIPDGYHTFCLANGEEEGLRGALIVAPAASWLPDALLPTAPHAGRVWGINSQLYAVRSRTNWGMGDFADLAVLANHTARLGGDVVGINPVHALFPSKPRDASPYSPSSRIFLNPMYINIEDMPEYPLCSAAQAIMADPAVKRRLVKAQQGDWVDYKAVATLKHDLFDPLFQQFEDHTPLARRKAFDAFVAEGGERLHRFAIFQVLERRLAYKPWRQWPHKYQRCDNPEVEAFALTHEKAVRFHKWLQFEADRQLAAAAKALTDGGGRIGLYLDLAVGVNSDGADTWMDPDVYASSARFGAPPDDLGPLGQDWGLPPLNPHTLRQRAYEPFIAMLRANMRHAGALRIDHAMALQHLFWIPPGHQAVDGIYVTYPMDDLMGIVALESHRNHCVVIGEDLGTVPPGFRERMAAENILSYRILYFERWENGLLHRPDVYPPLALATASSHDMAPIAGHWEGWDIALRHKLSLSRPDISEDQDLEARAADRAILIGALQDQDLLPADFPLTFPLEDSNTRALVLACHQFLARTPSRLMLMNLDDLACEVSQVNVPGTVDQYPNWSRRLSQDVESLMTGAYLRATAEAVSRDRGR